MYKNTLKSLALLAALTLATACNNQPKEQEAAKTANNETAKDTPRDAENALAKEAKDAPKEDAPVITFDKKEYDFGTVKAGDPVKYKFKFKNTGKTDLVVADAKASCGCTVPTVTKDPVKPGGEGEILVEFDSKGKDGSINKTVTVTSNASNGTETLTIKGFVKGMIDSKGPLANPEKK